MVQVMKVVVIRVIFGRTPVTRHTLFLSRLFAMLRTHIHRSLLVATDGPTERQTTELAAPDFSKRPMIQEKAHEKKSVTTIVFDIRTTKIFPSDPGNIVNQSIGIPKSAVVPYIYFVAIRLLLRYAFLQTLVGHTVSERILEIANDCSS